VGIRREPGVNGQEEAHGQPIRRNGLGAKLRIIGMKDVDKDTVEGWREVNALVVDRDGYGEMGAGWAAIEMDIGMVDLTVQWNVAVGAGFGHELELRWK
jgi:hypothetical protein